MDPGLIEKYQKLLLRDPRSKIFAPLAEAYRKMGLLKEAQETCEQGLKYHPHFAGGHVALAKVLMDLENYETAALRLQTAVEFSPENLLAHQLLADCQLKLKNAKQALKAYKMVLFLSPMNEKAAKAVKRLESLTADEYDDELFSMKPLGSVVKDLEGREAPEIEPVLPKTSTPEVQKVLERYLSLADAYAVRGDLDLAMENLESARHEYGESSEIMKRIRKILELRLDERVPPASTSSPPLENRVDLAAKNKIQFLEQVLKRLKAEPPRSS